MSEQDPRDVALSAAASGARVFIIATDGESFDAHIVKLLHGGFVAVVGVRNGRVERTIWYADVDSMAEYVEVDEPAADEHDDLMDLSRRLRAQASQEAQKSLAERMLVNHQRES